ncbi:hypothetical protein [Methanolacinia paynteri]|uniref:hypothetical protein n=1 Tax=Methanolacinia paynteri TaxID=230356 RepID=UPI0012F6C196|nr:hypothetical protein [Methanolacinia paynteri]
MIRTDKQVNYNLSAFKEAFAFFIIFFLATGKVPRAQSTSESTPFFPGADEKPFEPQKSRRALIFYVQLPQQLLPFPSACSNTGYKNLIFGDIHGKTS